MKTEGFYGRFVSGVESFRDTVKSESKTFTSGVSKVFFHCTKTISTSSLSFQAPQVSSLCEKLSRKVSHVMNFTLDAKRNFSSELNLGLKGQVDVFIGKKSDWNDLISIERKMKIQELKLKAHEFAETDPSDHRQARLAYILEVIDSPKFQGNPEGYLSEWIDRRGLTREYRFVEDAALAFFRKEFGIQTWSSQFHGEM